jgi:hypothetical protein
MPRRAQITNSNLKQQNELRQEQMNEKERPKTQGKTAEPIINQEKNEKNY